MNLCSRLEEMGITLPTVAPPVAAYLPAVRAGGLVWVSGQLPLVEGELICRGIVPNDASVERAAEGCRVCVLNALAAAEHALDGDWSGFERVVRLSVYVAGVPGFDQAHRVANGGSTLLQEVFGEAGRHARAAMAVAGLPLGASVEAELVLAVR